ncbi:MAG: hypothetical protein NHG36_20110 [Chromatiaceae bacterium]|nr:hypothetical protein [Candidatus Thioaporhodococcus sediminis]
MRNLFRRFSDLSGRSARTVGTCISADAGECTIQYPGGGLARVKGDGVEGTRYFVQAGRLDGEAPALDALTIEI